MNSRHPPAPFTLGALLFALLATGCQTGAPERDTHVVSSERLTTVMQRLESLVHERELPAGEIRQRRQSQARALAAVTDELITATHEIGGAMSANDAATFAALANQLRSEAKRIEQAASLGDPLRLQHAVDRLDQVCASCHARFREGGTR